MIIRDALETDARQIAALHAANWRFFYRGALSNEFLDGDIVSERSAFWVNHLHLPPLNQHVLVAENEGKVVGFACVYANVDEQWDSLLDNLHVSQSMQRRGIGAKLLEAVAQWCEFHKASRGSFLWVVQSNLQAQRFYQALGAVHAGSDLWVPPKGGHVPRYRFAWQSVSMLHHKAADHSNRSHKRSVG
jgi:GNAT superfamily N-acetyltransferase